MGGVAFCFSELEETRLLDDVRVDVFKFAAVRDILCFGRVG